MRPICRSISAYSCSISRDSRRPAGRRSVAPEVRARGDLLRPAVNDPAFPPLPLDIFRPAAISGWPSAREAGIPTELAVFLTAAFAPDESKAPAARMMIPKAVRPKPALTASAPVSHLTPPFVRRHGP